MGFLPEGLKLRRKLQHNPILAQQPHAEFRSRFVTTDRSGPLPITQYTAIEPPLTNR